MNDAATIIWRHGQEGIGVRCFGIDEMESQLRRTDAMVEDGNPQKTSKKSVGQTPLFYMRGLPYQSH